MARFIATARKRPQLELDECLGNYEFCIVPTSLFSVYGQPLVCSDKSKLLHLIEELADLALQTNLVKEHDGSCIIIAGMAVFKFFDETNINR